VGTNARDGAWSHDVALREGYVTWRLEAWTLRAGARLYSWGKNEWLAPANVLNPIDLRYDPFSVLEGPKDGRVPVWALDTSTDALGATWQLVVLPFFVPHALFVYGHEVSAEPFAGLYAPLLRDTLGALEPGARDALQGGMRGTRLPADSPGGASAALRVTRQLAGWDVAATGYYGWDRTPWIDLDADVATLLTAQARISADPTLLARDPALRTATLGVAQKRAAGVRLADVSYRRTGQLALEGERALGPMVVRLDVGYSPAQTLYTRELAPHRRGAWTGVVGVDAMQGDALITSVGLWGMVVPSPPANGVLLGLEPATDTPQARRAAWTMAALGAVRWHPADTAFEASAFATFGVRRRETVVWAQVAYMGFEPYRLALGCFGATGRAGSLTAALEAERYVFAQVSGAW
ncbi:MAG TPA: hypothetical protein VFH51_07950, partial [Myxococcota bacterium]|nr:hypothetical protein [Myxococcota bacterium]